MAGADWFETLTGFAEQDYATTQSRLAVEGDELVSTVNGRRYGVGDLSLTTLDDLRGRVDTAGTSRTTVHCIAGDVGALHGESRFDRALFQVASQFNLLEMVGPEVTPEDGVTGYAFDHTQGPTCAIAAGAATIYRNYFARVGEHVGQTRDRQLDGLAGVGAALEAELGRPVSDLWTMRNGYALCTQDGLARIHFLVTNGGETTRDALRGKLAIGLHRDVEVTGAADAPGRRVSQAFCSALPVTYGGGSISTWETFGRIVLEALYEATMLAAVEHAAAGASNIVLLTRVGGGVFGNADAWINDAIRRSLDIVEYAGLDVRLVSYGRVESSMQSIATGWNR